MTKQELVRAISMETGIDQTTALTAVEAFMEITKKTMADGENIYLRGFGTFNLKKRATKTARNICKKETIMKLAEFVDLFLFDIKHFDSDRHSELTGVRNEVVLENLEELLKNRYNVRIRMPMLKGINDSQEEIEHTMEFLLPFKDMKNFKGIDLLPYHKMGVNKYDQLDMDYAITDEVKLEQEDLDRIEGWISKYDLPVSVIRH